MLILVPSKPGSMALLNIHKHLIHDKVTLLPQELSNALLGNCRFTLEDISIVLVGTQGC